MTSRILIAERDVAAAGLLAGWLQSAGYQCSSTTPGVLPGDVETHEASVVLVRVGGPDGMPLTAIGALANRRTSRVAVIAIADPNVELACEAVRQGAADCLPWPSSRESVVDAVARVLHDRAANRVPGAGRRRAAMVLDRSELCSLMADADSSLMAVGETYASLAGTLPRTDPLTHDEVNAELVRMAGFRLHPDAVRAWIQMSEALRCC